jgi:hypothetical protein
MTLLEFVNAVLLRLREDAVADLSNSYSQLIAGFVADIHAEVVSSHDWSSMDVTTEFTVDSSAQRYFLFAGATGLYEGTDAPNRKSVVRFDGSNRPLAYLYDSLDDMLANRPLLQLAFADARYTRKLSHENSDYTARPSMFSVAQDAEDDGIVVELDTKPDKEYYVTIRFHRPEAPIDIATDVAREIHAPANPIKLGAVYLALNERGEELGEPGNVAERKYQSALGEEIETDSLHGQYPNAYEMYRD